ncbi:MAG: hypothetical protein NZM43_12720 [Saprospiraceae bacterium]|nr:hypothetical protein [Saprospiraceae bacterium]MDW8485176.1 hypothetical protein [Saprospiraceae bacterium]
MKKEFLWGAALLLCANGCEPPVRLRATEKGVERDSVHYVGIAENKNDIDLRKAQLLGTVKIGDYGLTLDCHYADVLERACRNAGRIGGNLLVITRHRRYQVKSNCHTVKAEIYSVPSLEGMESRMYWHPERRLLKGDLRANPLGAEKQLPVVHTHLTCRLGGDFFREAFIRTETLFFPDSAARPSDARLEALALRRAQLHFDLTELFARQLKAELMTFAPDLNRLVGEYRARTHECVRQLRAEQAHLDAALVANLAAADSILTNWENIVRRRLQETEAYFGQQRIDLRKRKSSPKS